MSEGNVELTHRVIEAFNRRDLAGYLELVDPNVEFTPYEVWVQGGNPYRGHTGVKTWWEDSFAVLPDLKAEIYEVRDFGEKTLLHGRLRAQGAGSGAPVERPCGWPSPGVVGRAFGGAHLAARPKPSKPPASRIDTPPLRDEEHRPTWCSFGSRAESERRRFPHRARFRRHAGRGVSAPPGFASAFRSTERSEAARRHGVHVDGAARKWADRKAAPPAASPRAKEAQRLDQPVVYSRVRAMQPDDARGRHPDQAAALPAR